MIEINLFVAGIFAYLNYLTPKSRKEILDLLVTGLKRLEYRGYDSSGVAVDSIDGKETILVRRSGKVQALEDAINTGECTLFSRIWLNELFRVFNVVVQTKINHLYTHINSHFRLFVLLFFASLSSASSFVVSTPNSFAVQNVKRRNQTVMQHCIHMLVLRTHVGRPTVAQAKSIHIHSVQMSSIRLLSCTMASSPTTKMSKASWKRKDIDSNRKLIPKLLRN